MKKDYWMEVDSKNQKIGFRYKKEFHTEKYIHKSVHLILINEKYEILLQKRESSKTLYPNRFTFSVSGAVEDESNLESIRRESIEELGCEFKVKELFDFYSQNIGIDKAFKTVFLAKYSEEKLIKDDILVNQLVWIPLEVLKQDLNKNKENYKTPFYKGMKIYFERQSN